MRQNKLVLISCAPRWARKDFRRGALVYNSTVANDHTILVGFTKAWGHNACSDIINPDIIERRDDDDEYGVITVQDIADKVGSC